MSIREENKPVLIIAPSYSLTLEKLLPFSKLHELWTLLQMFQRDYRVWKGRLRNGEKEEKSTLYQKERHTAISSCSWPRVFLNTLL